MWLLEETFLADTLQKNNNFPGFYWFFNRFFTCNIHLCNFTECYWFLQIFLKTSNYRKKIYIKTLILQGKAIIFRYISGTPAAVCFSQNFSIVGDCIQNYANAFVKHALCFSKINTLCQFRLIWIFAVDKSFQLNCLYLNKTQPGFICSVDGSIAEVPFC